MLLNWNVTLKSFHGSHHKANIWPFPCLKISSKMGSENNRKLDAPSPGLILAKSSCDLTSAGRLSSESG